MAAGLGDGGQWPGGLGTLCEIADLEPRGPGMCVLTLVAFSASGSIPLRVNRSCGHRERFFCLLQVDQMPVDYDNIIKTPCN